MSSVLTPAAGVDVLNVFDYRYLGRNYFKLLSDLGAHLMQGFLAAGTYLFVFFQAVFNNFHRQVFNQFGSLLKHSFFRRW